MEYLKADQLPFDPRPQMSAIFVEGFYQWLNYFSKDKEKLSKAFAHIFDLGAFYIAVENGEIAAIVACTTGKPPLIGLDKATLVKNLGLVRGNFAHFMLTKHLIRRKYPFVIPTGTGTIEFVATAPNHRGKGAAHGLITHIMETTSYTEYLLEVANNNTPAVRLYEKLGFTEFTRAPAPKQSGFNHLSYMKAEAGSRK